MSTGWLFGMGVLVTVMVTIGLGLPIYGAILDGRSEAERQAAEPEEPSRVWNGRRSAA